MPYKAACHLMKCDIVNDVKLFPTVYSRIYCRKFLTLSNQTSCYKSKCIRMLNYTALLNSTILLNYTNLLNYTILLDNTILLILTHLAYRANGNKL